MVETSFSGQSIASAERSEQPIIQNLVCSYLRVYFANQLLYHFGHDYISVWAAQVVPPPFFGVLSIHKGNDKANVGHGRLTSSIVTKLSKQKTFGPNIQIYISVGRVQLFVTQSKKSIPPNFLKMIWPQIDKDIKVNRRISL